jgi:hypothetical protein
MGSWGIMIEVYHSTIFFQQLVDDHLLNDSVDNALHELYLVPVTTL